MITREEALKLIEEHVSNKNIVKHMIALEAVMGGIFDELTNQRTDEITGSKAEWMMAGLLHDGDYCSEIPVEKQGIQITEWAKEKGYIVPENVAYTMAAHNWHNTKVEPKSLMDWSIFIADSLTGLIVACALVLPSKKLADVTVERVMKKFGQASFAAGTRREEIKMCEEKQGLTLEKLVGISLSSMQAVASEIGL